MSETQEWYYNDSTGAEHGPVTAAELQQLAKAGTIHSLTDVWTEGLKEWVPASQVDGLIPPEPEVKATVPAHQPQINLGPRPSFDLGAAIGPHPISKPKVKIPKSGETQSKWIVWGVIALLVITVGIFLATTSSEEEKPENSAGFTEYTTANDRVSASKEGEIHANGHNALKIAKAFSILFTTSQLPPVKETKTEEAPTVKSPDGQQPADAAEKEVKGKYPVYCMAKIENDQKTVLILTLIPNLNELAAEAKKDLTHSAWSTAKRALAGTTYSDSRTKLVVGIRGLTTYSKVMIGHPLMTKPAGESPLEGVTESHDGSQSEEKLYPFFARKK